MAEIGVNYRITADTGDIRSEIDTLNKRLATLEKTGDDAAEAVEDVAEETKGLGSASALAATRVKALDKSLASTDKQAKSAGMSAKNMRASFAASAGAMTVAAGAAVAVGGALFAAVGSANELIDRMGRLSAQTGQSTNTLLALESAAGAAGVQAEVVTASLGAFSGRLKEASVEGSTANKKFKEFGIELKNAAGETKSMDLLFREALTSIGDLTNETERSVRAVELFGEGGTKLLGVLGPGTATLDKWIDLNADLAALVEKNAENNAAWSEASVILNTKLEILTTTVGGDLMPAMTEAATATGALTDLAVGLWNVWGDWDPRMQQTTELLTAMNGALGFGEKEVTEYDKAIASLGQEYVVLNDAGEEVVMNQKEYDAMWKQIDLEKAADETAKLAAAKKQEAAETREAAAAARKHEAARVSAEKAAQREAIATEKADEKALDALIERTLAEAKLEQAIRGAAATAGTSATAQEEASARLAEMRSAESEKMLAANEERKAAEEQQRAEEEANRANAVQQTQASAVASMAAYDAVMARRIENLAAESAATQSALDNDAAMFAKHGADMTQDERNQLFARVAANKEALKKQEAAKKRAMLIDFRINKGAALVDIGIKTAQSVMAALTVPPPAGPILAGINIAAGAIQAGVVASQKPPSFRVGGIVPEDAPMLPGGLRDQRMIAAEPGEMILNQEQQAALGGGGGGVFVIEADGMMERVNARQASRQTRNAVARNTEIGVS